MRADVRLMDLLTLAHGIAVATQPGPGDPDQANRLLTVVLAGLRSPGATSRADQETSTGAAPSVTKLTTQ